MAKNRVYNSCLVHTVELILRRVPWK